MQLYRSMGDTPRGVLGAGLLALVLAGAPVGVIEAQARPSTPSMSCSQAAALVRSKGAVVLNTSSTTYDRYVRDVSFCAGSEQLKPEWVATRDVPQCFIGYTCIVPDRNNWIH